MIKRLSTRAVMDMNVSTLCRSLMIILMCYFTHSTTQTDLSILKIISNTGATHHFDIEVANTPSQHRKGLMYRKTLPKNQGMLFIYKKPRIISMWMKNTLLSLDMIFINKEGFIDSIAHDTQPFSTKTISSKNPCIGILEVNAGTSKRLSIKPGDKVKYSI